MESFNHAVQNIQAFHRVSQVVSQRKFGGEARNRTPILSERQFSRLVADLSARPLRSLVRTWRGTRDSNPVGTGLESVALPVESCPPWCQTWEVRRLYQFA